ncbi:MAG: acyl-CoA thioesterase [Christensenellales bacterium]|jgi:acyl-CoA hydrolase
MREKTTKDSYTEHVQILMPGMLNADNRLFGGQIMQWIDIVAGVVARRHSECTVTTAVVDTLTFQAAAYLGDTVLLCGKITYVGRTSMEVCVKSYAEHLDGGRVCINTAYVVLVALDDDEKPCEVPRLRLETEEEKADWAAGEMRNKLRSLRRTEKY